MRKRLNDSIAQAKAELTPVEEMTRPAPEAALRRKINFVKRQPASLARALGGFSLRKRVRKP
jgi:hypothetical protein